MPFPTFKTQDEVPEAFRSEYEEKDGLWVPKAVEPGPTRKQIEAREAAAIKRAKDAEARAAELEQELTAKNAGVSAEELQKVRANVEKEWKAKVDALSAEKHELTFGAQMNALLADAGVVDVSDARSILGPRFELSEAGALVPKDDKSVPAKQYLESLRAEKGHLFKGSQADGGGAPGSKGPMPKGKLSHEEFRKLTPQQQLDYSKAHEKAA